MGLETSASENLHVKSRRNWRVSVRLVIPYVAIGAPLAAESLNRVFLYGSWNFDRE